MSTEERRQSFRMSDQIGLRYAVLEKKPESLDPYSDTVCQNPAAYLLSDLYRLETEGHHLLKPIGDHNPHLLQYLKILNKRLQCLTALVAESFKEAAPSLMEVTLSDSGLDFVVQASLVSNLAVSAWLHMELMLPSATPARIMTFAQVVRCDRREEHDQSMCKVGVCFHGLRESDQQLIARYLLQRQSALIREGKRW